MPNGIVGVPTPKNEPVLGYTPQSTERAQLGEALRAMSKKAIEVTPVIDGRRVRTGELGRAVKPHEHAHVLATWHKAGKREVSRAIAAARNAHGAWSRMPWESRAAIFLKAADLLAGPWRMRLNAATMLGQSKTSHQAEIDAACELIDFFRFNVHFMREIYAKQPESSPGMWNTLEYRALEGFVFAVTPFNFTSIAGNLPTAPALMGNTVVWKPASSAVYSAWFVMNLLEEAGLPPGVINFVPGSAGEVGDPALASEELAGIHFTGSTAVFQDMWRTIGANIHRYRGYPRIVGETGGKDFVFADPSANVDALATALVRGAFEFQGQKCSAASRAYIPASLWPRVERGLKNQIGEIAMGDPADFRNFMGAVIDAGAFKSIKGYIDFAKRSRDAQIVIGGGCDARTGYFVEPTVIRARRPDFRLIREEIFGPVLTIYVYPDRKLDETLALCDSGSPYALTGAIFSQDRYAIVRMTEALTHAAGNFYINDKPTGAVVGQQPFGGGRASGTNDKAGSYLNLIRWTSARAIKETFVPATHFSYPFLR